MNFLERIGLSAERDTLVKSLPAGLETETCFLRFHLSRTEDRLFWMSRRVGWILPTRRQFWELIYQAADRGITVFVTTHFMDEAEYCDRISIMVDGVIRALIRPMN